MLEGEAVAGRIGVLARANNGTLHAVCETSARVESSRLQGNSVACRERWAARVSFRRPQVER
jgi:hypothetical protein